MVPMRSQQVKMTMPMQELLSFCLYVKASTVVAMVLSIPLSNPELFTVLGAEEENQQIDS